ncbi:MAG: DUF3365 domain-containing protein [Pseudomonadales bacterium]
MNKLPLSRNFLLILSLILALPPFLFSNIAFANEVEDAKLSKNLATLYRSARKVISDNQALINDASKGDKGLSATAVTTRAKAIYKKAAGQTLSIGKYEKKLLAAVTKVMNDAQDLINQKDVGFKGFLPAIFARQVATEFSSATDGLLTIKLTAPKNYVRNRANRPDKWESNIIENSFRSADYPKGRPKYETTTVKGKPAFRYILPEYYAESCLKCHGEPKGDIDITGGKKEGGVFGELGGAISLVLFK